MAIFLTAETKHVGVVFEVTGVVLDVFGKVGNVNKGVLGFLLFRVIPISAQVKAIAEFLKKMVDLGQRLVLRQLVDGGLELKARIFFRLALQEAEVAIGVGRIKIRVQGWLS